MSKRKVLITGGAGFIGSWLTDLIRNECEVVLFDSLHPQVHGADPAKSRAEAKARADRLIEGDVGDRAAVERVIAETDPEVVFHLAAETGTGQSYDEPTRYNHVNVIGTTHLIEAIRAHGPNVRRVVVAGSRSVYGEGACRDGEGRVVTAPPRDMARMKAGDFGLYCEAGRPLTPIATPEDIRLMPASVYASSKLMQEYLIEQCFHGTEVEVSILRLQNVYGPGQSLKNPYTGVISIMSQQIEQGKRLNVYEDGQIVRDFVFVGDVARAFALAGLGDRPTHGPVNIGHGQPTTILQMAEELLRLYGRDPGERDISGDFRAGDVRYALGDIARARDVLGFAPEVDFAQGLARFFDWARAA
ncbi:MAG: NAD-dependent epimerase/dehydratase family protein [Pseudomonadota bacterium]